MKEKALSIVVLNNILALHTLRKLLVSVLPQQDQDIAAVFFVKSRHLFNDLTKRHMTAGLGGVWHAPTCRRSGRRM